MIDSRLNSTVICHPIASIKQGENKLRMARDVSSKRSIRVAFGLSNRLTPNNFLRFGSRQVIGELNQQIVKAGLRK